MEPKQPLIFKRTLIAIVVVLVLSVGGVGFWLGQGKLAGLSFTQDSLFTLVHNQNSASSAARLTNPLLDCDENGLQNFSNKFIKGTKQALNKYIDRTIGGGLASHISVYFRDLNNGPWLGINEHEQFIPGSLLKVPLMIGTLKFAEADPHWLQQKVAYKGPVVERAEHFPTEPPLTPGTVYSIDELIRAMIKHSDNEAANLLFQVLPAEKMTESYSDLGINFPTDASMSVKTYASFFRILFNATYLNRDDSEKALGYLANTDFTKGLVSGVPASLTVAHKFGERGLAGSNEVQLHDCGIVYYPDRPFLLCIMTRGTDFDTLVKVVATVSQTVYDNVVHQW